MGDELPKRAKAKIDFQSFEVSDVTETPYGESPSHFKDAEIKTVTIVGYLEHFPARHRPYPPPQSNN